MKHSHSVNDATIRLLDTIRETFEKINHILNKFILEDEKDEREQVMKE